MNKIWILLVLVLAGCSGHTDQQLNVVANHFKLTDLSSLTNIADDCDNLKDLDSKGKVVVSIYNGTSVKEWSRMAYPSYTAGKTKGFDKGAYTLEYLNLGLNKKTRSQVNPGDNLAFFSPRRMGVEIDLDSSFVKAVVEKRVILTGITAKKH